MKRTPLARTAGLPRHTGFSRRRQPLAAKSTARAGQQAAQRVAYAAAGDSDYCEVCGVTGQHLDHSHHFTQKAYPEHANNPLNFQLQCRDCHELWENRKAEFAATHPKPWARILARMQAVDYRAYSFFRMKHSY